MENATLFYCLDLGRLHNYELLVDPIVAKVQLQRFEDRLLV
jgi:hypothetical protein